MSRSRALLAPTLSVRCASAKSIHDDVNELSAERRNGYSWYNAASEEALDRYAEWTACHPPAAATGRWAFICRQPRGTGT